MPYRSVLALAIKQLPYIQRTTHRGALAKKRKKRKTRDLSFFLFFFLFLSVVRNDIADSAHREMHGNKNYFHWWMNRGNVRCFHVQICIQSVKIGDTCYDLWKLISELKSDSRWKIFINTRNSSKFYQYCETIESI